MKRKGSEGDVLEDPSDCFVSTPATKSRRLDVISLPVLEVEPEIYGVPMHRPSVEHSLDMEDHRIQPISVTTEVGVPFMPNQDRSMVLYKPIESSSYSPPFNMPIPVSSGISFMVDSDLMASLKNQSRIGERISWTEVGRTDSLAVVPWVPPPHMSSVASLTTEAVSSEPMKVEGIGTDMEEDTEICKPVPVSSGVVACKTPQRPHASPVLMSFW